MRYVPNLIPKELKVLPEYFKGTPYTNVKPNIALTLFGYTGAVIFFLFSILCIKHVLLFLLYGCTGFIFLPQGHRFLERSLRFRLTTKIKAVTCSLLFIVTLPVFSHYYVLDQAEIKAAKAQELKEQNDKVEAEKILADKKDSFNKYYAKSISLEKDGKRDEALHAIDTASNYAIASDEVTLLQIEKDNLSRTFAISLVKKGKFKEALPILTDLLSRNSNNTELLCNQALCLHRIGNTQEAVNDLKIAMQLGSKEAEKLHNEINPLRRRVSYYITLCCDGTTSNATGRGACSWHGGVCEWNHPVYEEYRKYE